MAELEDLSFKVNFVIAALNEIRQYITKHEGQWSTVEWTKYYEEVIKDITERKIFIAKSYLAPTKEERDLSFHAKEIYGKAEEMKRIKLDYIDLEKAIRCRDVLESMDEHLRMMRFYFDILT